MMKAVVYHEYGSPDVLQLQEIDIPVVHDDGVLVRVHAASVNWIDWHFLTGTPLMARMMSGLFKPKRTILGVDLAGRVEAVGRNAKRFRPGEEVFGGSGNGGSFAEYVCVGENEIQRKPANITFEEAASVCAAAGPALQGLRDKGQIRAGHVILINGASGGLGTFAVQIAKWLGAVVTGVCSTRNLDMVRSIGADQVIDYTQADFTQGPQRYDLIFDAVAKLSFAACRRVLNPGGIYVTTAFSPALALQGLWISMTGDRKLVPFLAKPPSTADQTFVRELLQDGKLTPVIDRTYTLREVPEALRYLAGGHARGKIIITV